MVTIKDYDESLLNKVKDWYPHTYLTRKPNDIEQIKNSLDGEELPYPYICISRIQVPKLLENNTNSFRHGIGDNKSMTDTRYLKFKLIYQLDICSKSKESYDNLLVELQVALTSMSILVLPSSSIIGDITPIINLTDLVDNSDIEDFTNSPQVYRATMDLEIEATIIKTKPVGIIENVEVTH